jgi:hypothetical protein
VISFKVFKKGTAVGLPIALILIMCLAACQKASNNVPAPTALGANEQFTVNIYVPKKDCTLDAVSKTMKKSANQYKTTLEALFKADHGNFFPEGVKVRNVKVDSKGHAVVDLSREILNKKATVQEGETLGVGAIVQTLAEFKKIKTVTISVEGKTKGRIGGKDISRFWGFNSLKKQPYCIKPSEEETQTEDGS